jgi:hypothetical protein
MHVLQALTTLVRFVGDGVVKRSMFRRSYMTCVQWNSRPFVVIHQGNTQVFFQAFDSTINNTNNTCCAIAPFKLQSINELTIPNQPTDHNFARSVEPLWSGSLTRNPEWCNVIFGLAWRLCAVANRARNSATIAAVRPQTSSPSHSSTDTGVNPSSSSTCTSAPCPCLLGWICGRTPPSLSSRHRVLSCKETGKSERSECRPMSDLLVVCFGAVAQQVGQIKVVNRLHFIRASNLRKYLFGCKCNYWCDPAF